MITLEKTGTRFGSFPNRGIFDPNDPWKFSNDRKPGLVHYGINISGRVCPPGEDHGDQAKPVHGASAMATVV
jgi:hypothetical protein